MGSRVKRLNSLDLQEVGTDSINLGSHRRKKFAELLHIRFTGCIINCSFAFGKNRRHHNIGCTCNGCLIKKHVASLKGTPIRHPEIESLSGRIIYLLGTKLHHSDDMGINSTAADLISSGFREICMAETRKKRSHHHH